MITELTKNSPSKKIILQCIFTWHFAHISLVLILIAMKTHLLRSFFISSFFSSSIAENCRLQAINSLNFTSQQCKTSAANKLCNSYVCISHIHKEVIFLYTYMKELSLVCLMRTYASIISPFLITSVRVYSLPSSFLNVRVMINLRGFTKYIT